MDPPKVMGAPPERDEGKVGSSPAFAPPCAYDVELGGDVVDRRQAAVDALVVHDGQHLLIDRQGGERRLGDVHRAHAFLGAGVVDRGQPVAVVRGDVRRRIGRRQDPGRRRGRAAEPRRDGAHDDGSDWQQQCRDPTMRTLRHVFLPPLDDSSQSGYRKERREMYGPFDYAGTLPQAQGLPDVPAPGLVDAVAAASLSGRCVARRAPDAASVPARGVDGPDAIRTRAGPSSPRQAEHPLGHDVALDLRRAAGDGAGERA